MYPRFVELRIRDALADARVVVLSGPRQSGKTTLGRKFADGGMTYMTLDNVTVLDAARPWPHAGAQEKR
jgi:predicted AAA+ superfamily ATPase